MSELGQFSDNVGESAGRRISSDRGIVYYLVAFYGFSALARFLIQTVVPLKALSILEQPSRVSLGYFLAGVSSLCASICLPFLANVMFRHVVALFGVAIGLVGLVFLTTENQIIFVAGLALQVSSVVIIEIVVSLFALDNFRRTDFGYYEPLRMFFAAVACVLGPMCGILSEKLSPAAPFVLSALALVTVGLFAFGARRLRTNKQGHSQHPLQFISGFFSQPRMRLAYVIAAGRSAWWTMFFIFTPIYVVSYGYSKVTATAVVTISSCFMLTVPVWGVVARRFGVRRVLITGFSLCAVFSIVAGALADPLPATVSLFLASIALCTLDGTGNVFFLRAVRPLRRTEMTAIFQTFRDVGQAIPQLVFAGLLIYLSIGSVFVLSGIAMLGLARLSRHVPRKM